MPPLHRDLLQYSLRRRQVHSVLATKHYLFFPHFSCYYAPGMFGPASSDHVASEMFSRGAHGNGWCCWGCWLEGPLATRERPYLIIWSTNKFSWGFCSDYVNQLQKRGVVETQLMGAVIERRVKRHFSSSWMAQAGISLHHRVVGVNGSEWPLQQVSQSLCTLQTPPLTPCFQKHHLVSVVSLLPLVL